VYRATITITHNANENPLEIFVEFLVPEPVGIWIIGLLELWIINRKFFPSR